MQDPITLVIGVGRKREVIIVARKLDMELVAGAEIWV